MPGPVRVLVDEARADVARVERAGDDAHRRCEAADRAAAGCRSGFVERSARAFATATGVLDAARAADRRTLADFLAAARSGVAEIEGQERRNAQAVPDAGRPGGDPPPLLRLPR